MQYYSICCMFTKHVIYKYIHHYRVHSNDIIMIVKKIIVLFYFVKISKVTFVLNSKNS